MALDRIQQNKLVDWANRDIPGLRLDTSTYVGVVKNNADPLRSGRLQVWIPDFGGMQLDNEANENDPAFWRTVSYASPFFGRTYQPYDNVINSYENSVQTYGMWFVPPDVGNQVLCTFVNGDPDRGYWFSCISPQVGHYMVPGQAAGNKVDRDTVSGIQNSLLPEDNIPPQSLPVGEFNENQPDALNTAFYNNPKPINDFQANVLFKQGLDRDSTRGAISSSSQRESPSAVFGINTPGRSYQDDPADDPLYREKLRRGEITLEEYAVTTRKGGHTFVMDDGDVTGKDQLIRLRTAGGHQLLMNDTEKVMYLANSEGSVWMEFAESGHVHVYASGGYNLHTEGDYNVHAGGSINMHAEGSVNLNAGADISGTSSRITWSCTDSMLLYGGTVNMGSGGALNLGASTLSVSASGEVGINGSTIDLNSGSASSSITGVSLQQNSHSDTGFDDQSGLWSELPGATRSITTVMPQHEPWTRQGVIDVLGPALSKSVSDSICPPKAGAASATDYTLPPPNGNTLDRGRFRGQPAPWTTDNNFLDKVKQICNTLSVNYIDMLAVMNLESARSFDPWIQNNLGYTGLIQFGRAAAQTLGTTTEYLRQLNRVDQCDWVLKYFQYWMRVKGLSTLRLVDMYLTVLWPAGVGRPDDFVIFPRGSREYNANPAFDPGRQVGFVTVGMVAQSIAIHVTEVKQALANAGETTQSLQSGTGVPVTDGSGNVVRSAELPNTTADTEDQGIKKAAGVSIDNNCPGEWLLRPEAFTPPGGIGDGEPKFTQLQVQAMMAELGYFESRWEYTKVSGAYIGKYQVDAAYLAEQGYIKPDAVRQYRDSAVNNPESWAGKSRINSLEAFGQYTNVQEDLQYSEFQSNYRRLITAGGIKSEDDICTAAGMLFVAHQLRSVDAAIDWRESGEGTDSRGVDSAIYFNHGRYAIDVLSASGAITGDTAISGLGGENTTGINPDDVFNFQTSGTGTRAKFDQLTSEFKNAILRAAQAYKQKTGSKITITSAYRSQEEQSALYNAWQAAGGRVPGRPTVSTPRGRITTPAKSVGSHGGVAIDSGQAAVMAKTINLSEFGLRWGGTFRTPDPVHIQLANWQR